MNFKRILFLAFLMALACETQAQRKLTPEEYIRFYKDAAIADMKKTGVPASITLAQGMFESDNGNSPLAVASNNHFGVKCHKEWDGERYYHDDDRKGECFRKYKTVQESFDDHSYFLKSRERYSSLFQLPVTDYKGWAYGLKKAGYATNPQYPQRIIKLVEDYRLFEMDKCKDGPCGGGEYLADIIEKPAKPLLSKPVNNNTSNSNNTTNKTKAIKTISVESRTGEINDVQYAVVRPGDTYLKIAQEFNLGLWQLFKYNEISKEASLHTGQKLFLAHKKRNIPEAYHIVKQGETIHDIAQQYAIKSKRIYKFNKAWLNKGEEPKPGDKILLKKA